jgi:hypothetical protein
MLYKILKLVPLPYFSSKKDAADDLIDIASLGFVDELFSALPLVVAILNDKRQIIYTNSNSHDHLMVDDLKLFLGKKPGNLLSCSHASNSTGGCGSTKNCRYCGVVNTIEKCMSTRSKVIGECSISSNNNGKEQSHDFEVPATPLSFGEKSYTILSLKDISSDKRRRILERIFFHDILNTAGNLSGIIDIIDKQGFDNKTQELFGIISGLSKEIIDEIMSQKVLLMAESGELRLNERDISVSDLLTDIKNEYSLFQDKKREINILPMQEDFELYTDRVLLGRILKNMIRNAVEASKQADVISISATRNGVHLRFTVHNSTYIPEETQIQIFKRSFSTKGQDRGIGTYSMKLLGEKYLNGKVAFSSSENEGTSFFFDHPL